MKIEEKKKKYFQVMEFNTMNLNILPSLSYLCQCIIIIFDKTKYYTFSKIRKLISYLTIKNSNNENECINIILVSSFDDIEKSEVEENEINDLINNSFSRESSMSKDLDSNKYLDIPIVYISISNITKHNILKLKNIIINTFKTKIYLSPPIQLFSNEKNISKEIIKKISPPKQKILPLTNNIEEEELYNEFKIILLGDTTVGKTAFFRRFFLNEFSDSFTSTLGINETSKYVKIDNKIFKIQIWDTAGQKRFKTIPQKYYEKADGIILIYDITNEESFNNISQWTKDIRKTGNEHLIVYLLGNKVDLIEERKIYAEQGRQIAFNEKMKFIEISCKWDLNVSDIVFCLVYDMYLVIKLDEKKLLELDKNAAQSKSSCF